MKEDQIERLIGALERISHGERGDSMPDGLALVAIALGGREYLSTGASVAESIDNLARATRELAQEIRTARYKEERDDARKERDKARIFAYAGIVVGALGVLVVIWRIWWM